MDKSIVDFLTSVFGITEGEITREHVVSGVGIARDMQDMDGMDYTYAMLEELEYEIEDELM